MDGALEYELERRAEPVCLQPPGRAGRALVLVSSAGGASVECGSWWFAERAGDAQFSMLQCQPTEAELVAMRHSPAGLMLPMPPAPRDGGLVYNAHEGNGWVRELAEPQQSDGCFEIEDTLSEPGRPRLLLAYPSRRQLEDGQAPFFYTTLWVRPEITRLADA